MDLEKGFKIPSYLVIESGSSRSKPDEVMTTLYSRGARNALFSLTDAEWRMSIKNGRSPALLFFFFYCFSNVTLLSRRRLDSSRVIPGSLLEPIWCETWNRRGKQCITDDLPWCIQDVWLKYLHWNCVLMLNWIIWNGTVFWHWNCAYTKLIV